MTIDQLKLLVQQAATELAQRNHRPIPVTIVLPLPNSTKVLSLEAFPDDDDARQQALSVVAARQMVPGNASCFGFVAEASGPSGEDLLVIVYGARRRGAHVTAAEILEDGSLSEFTEAEPLEPSAMPFIQPLQHAADMSEPPEDPGGTTGLPILS